MAPGIRVLVLTALVGACHHQAPAPRPPEESLAIPIQETRVWATALAPNARGGWNFILQTYELGSGKPTEFTVLDLQSGRSRVFEGPADIYTNSNYQVSEQLRAANGRIFFPESEGHLAYYDPRDESVKQLGQVVPDKGDFIFRMAFGPDGLLYGGTQSKGLPTIFVVDPETLRVRILGRVGVNRNGYSYAYYLAADPPWIYTTVGQDPWELVAFDMRSGASRVLATRGADGFMQLDVRPTGVMVTLISQLRTAAQKTDRIALVDGALQLQALPVQASKARAPMPISGALPRMPELDLAQVTPDAGGVGRVRWRASAKGPWRTASFKVKYATPVPIESLISLPDGTLIGNARQYHGFFRYDPKRRSMTRYGHFPLSGGPRVVVDGKLYIAGYPNSTLYRLDPKAPWSAANPSALGAFGAGAHYPYFLVPSRNKRLYYSGRRERTGVGGAVGYYNTQTRAFAGHHDRLDALDPQGLLVLDDLDRVVFSGRLRPGVTETATLVVYDRELHEMERLTIKPGMRSSGTLFPTSTPGVFIGVSALDHAIYRYDLAHHRLLDWRDVPGAIGPSTAHDRAVWFTVDSDLIRLDEDFRWRTVRRLRVAPADGDLFAWLGKHLYWAHGAELRAVNLSSD